MSARDRLRYENVFESLGQPLQGSFFRNIDAMYRWAPLSAYISHLNGNRYNRGLKYETSAFAALYLSDSPVHAMEEVKALVNGVAQKFSPRTDLTVDVVLARVADLTDPSTQKQLEVHPNALVSPWQIRQITERTTTQELGAAAFDVGIEALLVPSARVKGAKNLVVLIDQLAEGSSLQVFVGEGKLRLGRDTVIGRPPHSTVIFGNIPARADSESP